MLACMATLNSFAQAIVSPEDTDRMLTISEAQWAMEVAELSRLDGISSQRTLNGSRALVTKNPFGAMTITPVYSSNRKEHPNYLVLEIRYDEAKTVKQLSAPGVLDKICEKALAPLRQTFSAVCLPVSQKDFVALSFQISKPGRNADLDRLQSEPAPNTKALNDMFADKELMGGEIDRRWRELEGILTSDLPEAQWIDSFTKEGPEICMRLAVAYRAIGGHDITDREGLMFDMDVCMKAAAHRRAPQPEFKNPSILKSICGRGYIFYDEICKRSGLQN